MTCCAGSGCCGPVDVGWEQATEAEASALVGWLRDGPNPQRQRRDAGQRHGRGR